MNRTKFEHTKVELQQTTSDELDRRNEALVTDSRSLSDSLAQAQNQLKLCLQKQRQVSFILKELKDILKR